MPSLRKMLITFILTVPCLMPKAAPIISLVIGYGDNHIQAAALALGGSAIG